MRNTLLILALALGLTQSSLAAEAAKPQEVKVTVTENGFEPSELHVQAGKEIWLTITRKTEETCAKTVMIPKFKMKESLPLNKPVTLKLAKLEKGELKFSCGMGMVGAVIIAQ